MQFLTCLLAYAVGRFLYDLGSAIVEGRQTPPVEAGEDDL